MARKLNLRVQADRWPGAPAGAVWIGFRISADILADGADLAKADDAKLLLPWTWKKAGGGGDPFPAQDPAAWTIWRWNQGHWTALDPGLVTAKVTAPATFDSANPPRLRSALEAAAARIVKSSGPRPALEAPQPGAAITLRGATVFGLVDGLAALPHPCPVGLKVWALFEIAGHTEGDIYVAAPRFVSDWADGSAPAALPAPEGDGWRVTSAAGRVTSFMRASASADPRALEVTATSPELAARDDAAELPARIAAAIDPWSHIVSAVDRAIPEWLALPPADPLQPGARAQALVGDLQTSGPPSGRGWLTRLIDTGIWASLAERVYTTPVGVSPALALLRHAADTADPGDRLHVAPLAVLIDLSDAATAAAGAASRSAPFAPDWFCAIDPGRLASLAGLSVDPRGLEPSRSRTPPLDADAALRAWAPDYWSGSLPLGLVQSTVMSPSEPPAARPLAAGKSRSCLVVRQLATAWAQTQPTEDLSQLRPLLDLKTLMTLTAAPLAVSVRIAGPGPGKLTIAVLSGIDTLTTLKLELSSGQATAILSVSTPGQTNPAPTSVAWGGHALFGELSIWCDASNLHLQLSLTEEDASNAPLNPAPIVIPLGSLSEGLRLQVSAANASFDDVRFGVSAEQRSAVRDWLAKLPDGGAAIRDALRLAAAGPVLQSLLMANPADPRDLPARLGDQLKSFITQQYQDLRDATLQRTGASQTSPIVELFKAILDAARDSALRGLGRLFTAPGDVRVTSAAAPFRLGVDQLQTFPEGADRWERWAGIGVLVGRSDDGGQPSQWYSLNAADLCAPVVASGVRDVPDVSTNGVTTGLVTGADYRVDPAPVQLAERGGVRMSLLRYDGRSIAVSMPVDHELGAPVDADGNPVTDASGAPLKDGPRRPEALVFPQGLLLPALTFGRHYHFKPYVVGLGGILPPDLRGANPCVLSRTWTPPATGSGVFKRQYLRTTAIGAPRLVKSGLPGVVGAPGVPEGVAPLAAELPIRPPPVTLLQGVAAWFFRDPTGPGGLLDFAAEGDGRLARIEIGAIPADAVGNLQLKVEGAAAYLSVDLNLADYRGQGVRIDVSDSNAVLFKLQPGDWSEDEPSALFVQNLTCTDTRQWRGFAINLTFGGGAVTLEAPTASLGLRTSDPAAFPGNGATEADVVGLHRYLPAESHHQSRTVVLLDGFKKPTGRAPTTFTVTLRRPSVDFATFERWLNDRGGGANKAAIDKAFARTTDISAADRTLPDPATNALRAELVRIFPTPYVWPMLKVGRDWSDLIEDSPGAEPDTRAIKVQADTNGSGEGLSTLGDGLRAVLGAGGVYELRVYPVVPNQRQEVVMGAHARLDRVLRAGLRQDGADLLGAPLILTFEVATEAMPDLYGESVLALQDVARPTWPARTGPDTARISLAPQWKAYPKLRYVGRAALISQRWSWRGRPQTDDLFRDPALANSADHWAPVDAAHAAVPFAGRRDDDVGALIERTLTRAHVYGGRRQLKDSPAKPPVLIEKNLDYRGGANLWRFALKATSRYAALGADSSSLERFSHQKADKSTLWDTRLLRDRPTGRRLKRPALNLVLPLTEPLMAAGAVPPLLVLLNEPWFVGFNVADEIEGVIEVVRHPLPADLAHKHLQQRGPDPIRTARPASDQAMGLRFDGPLGYTFDPETEAGRFSHCGWMVTPVAVSPDPWSMMRLQLRRWEDPSAMDPDPDLLVADLGNLAGLATPVPASGDNAKVFRIANELSLPPVAAARPGPAGETAFAIEHEGLVIDAGIVPLADATSKKPAPEMTVSFRAVGKAAATANVKASAFIVPVDETRSQLTVTTSTNLGGANTFTLPIAPGATVRLWVVISGREPPQDGKDPYAPAGDVSVRLWIERTDTVDTFERPEERRWITANCLTLLADPTAEQKILPGTPPTVQISGTDLPAAARIRPIRLSPFTPAVWCQFAESMSAVRAAFEAQGGTSTQETLSVDALSASIDVAARTVTLGLVDGRKAKTLAPLGETDALAAQVEEVLLAVVTVYSNDAFARGRERPMWISELKPDGSSLSPIWADPKAEAAAKAGRVRLLRLLRTTGQPPGTPLETLLFGANPIESDAGTMDANPPDVGGMLLGISRPVEWGRA